MGEAGPLYAVVLAGGSGTRFWPLSRELSPKQMLSLFGGTSLIARALSRVTPFIEPDGVLVVTSERLYDELRNHIKAQPAFDGLDIDYLVEPSARNTAAAVALAAAILVQRDPDAVFVMVPSDHLLAEDDAWRETVHVATRLAASGRLVTIGLAPDSPETGYGYIRPGELLDDPGEGSTRGRAVAEFVEKPDAEKAETLVAQGCLWNSGMLVARAADVLAELRAAGRAGRTPDSASGVAIADAAQRLAALPRERWLTDEGRAIYAALPAVPFDKAVLEVSDKVAVVPTTLDWSDVGSLLAIEDLGEPDERGNVLIGRAVDVGSHGVLSYSADRLVATLGLDDVLVVDTADATLVAAKDRAQDVRLVVDALSAVGAPEVVASRSSLRPWGSWTLLMTGEGYKVKSIDVLPGSRLSSQSHRQRSEHWIVISGEARVTRDGESFDLGANESVHLPMGCVHRLENPGTEPLKVIEVATGEYLGEDDIERYEDDFGR
jgi:mannose-1-phosphate guanylyltransferase/mannose-6-phosphate isomerase